MPWRQELVAQIGKVGDLIALAQLLPLVGRVAENRSASALPEPSAVPAPDATAAPRSPEDAEAVVRFWREAGPTLWFAKEDDFDRLFRDKFLDLHEAAARSGLNNWLAFPIGSLALLILLDQFPRNAFRGSPRMYETDALARDVARAAIAAGHDRSFEPDLQPFFYLPFGHSEELPDQELSVSLCRRLGEPTLSHAVHHHDIVKRFGRFPHRNLILGREMRPEEQRYLDEGGYRG